jgi:hypothetical protein
LTKHFLFQPGIWQGSGQITIPLSETPFPLVVSWTVTSLGDGRFRAVQRVEVEDHDPMVNTFTVGSAAEGEFQIYLENETIGMFSGSGVSDNHRLAWEFTHKNLLEGYEVYERTDGDKYSFRAEYLGGEGFATVVSGTIMKKEES